MYTTYDEVFEDLVDVDERLRVVADGFRFLEGPAWDHARKRLYFSDIPGNAIYAWEEGRGVQMLRPNSYLANGNTLDRAGRLITCEHGTSRVTRTDWDGGVYETLADRYGGKQLNSPNDVIVKSDGAVYFTDPYPGRMPRVGIPRPQELSFQGVYMVKPEGGEPILLADHLKIPNGLCFDTGEKRLFVNDSDTGEIHCFPVLADGTAGGGKVWAKVEGDGPGVADGLKIDAGGFLYCAGPGGLYVFDAGARCVGKILTPDVCANFTWGGDDFRTLFLAANSTLYALRVRSPGRPTY